MDDHERAIFIRKWLTSFELSLRRSALSVDDDQAAICFFHGRSFSNIAVGPDLTDNTLVVYTNGVGRLAVDHDPTVACA